MKKPNRGSPCMSRFRPRVLALVSPSGSRCTPDRGVRMPLTDDHWCLNEAGGKRRSPSLQQRGLGVRFRSRSIRRRDMTCTSPPAVAATRRHDRRCEQRDSWCNCLPALRAESLSRSHVDRGSRGRVESVLSAGDCQHRSRGGHGRKSTYLAPDGGAHRKSHSGWIHDSRGRAPADRP